MLDANAYYAASQVYPPKPDFWRRRVPGEAPARPSPRSSEGGSLELATGRGCDRARAERAAQVLGKRSLGDKERRTCRVRARRVARCNMIATNPQTKNDSTH
jgi:hypothetical protein